jgi:hypothetical protein
MVCWQVVVVRPTLSCIVSRSPPTVQSIRQTMHRPMLVDSGSLFFRSVILAATYVCPFQYLILSCLVQVISILSPPYSLASRPSTVRALPDCQLEASALASRVCPCSQMKPPLQQLIVQTRGRLGHERQALIHTNQHPALRNRHHSLHSRYRLEENLTAASCQNRHLLPQWLQVYNTDVFKVRFGLISRCFIFATKIQRSVRPERNS